MNMKIHRKQHAGYILLEVLIAVIVILGLTLWWVRIQSHNNKLSMANVMTQQINAIISAITNDYQQNRDVRKQWPRGITMNRLIHGKYLLARDQTNPFHFPYQLEPDPANHTLVLSTQLANADAFIAYKVSSAFADSTVTVPPNHHDNVMLRISMNQPRMTSSTSDINFFESVTPGTVLNPAKMNCPPGESPTFKPIPKECPNCVAKATKNMFTGNWTVENKKLTRTGWAQTSESVRVASTCRKP